MMSDLIREGFICPECQKDLTCFELLQAHFEIEHANKGKSNDDKTNSLSSVFNKAKSLVIRSPENSTNSQNTQSVSVLDDYQEIGVNRSFTNEFKNHRDNTIGRYVIQTNKLLTTLDKLISQDITFKDENKRKQFEQTIVQWVSDSDVKLCPTCARQFNLIHRKHHCRLCGAIMCNKCSQFLSHSLAKQLTDPSLFIANLKDNELKIKRSNSQTSLNSSMNDGSNEHFYRMCANCISLLNKKYQSLKEKSNKPKICGLYDDFHVCIKEADKMYPAYTKIAESLSAGETVYNLKNAEDMRLKLMQTFQRIDLLSNTILSLQESESKAKDQSKLQRNIRLFAVNYLKEYSFQLTSLPNEEQYEKLKEQKQRHLIEELEKEKRAQLQQQKQFKTNNTSQDQVKKNLIRHIDNSAGWIPKQMNSNDDEDPIRIQIKLVKGYLDDAKAQNRLPEVELLENNLKELYLMLNN